MKFAVEPDIFDLFSGMRIVTVYVEGIGGPTDEDGITALLEESWKTAGEAASAYGNPQSHPNIVPWVTHMKEAGAPRKKFPSSIEAMVRRAGKGGEPFRISPVVDFYNAVSLKNIIPAGGYDTDQLEDALVLRKSVEGDTFTALDSDETIEIPAGEVSYADGHKIITRHFLWRQSRHMLITPETKNIFFVSEIPGELPDEVVETVADDLVSGLKKYFGKDAASSIVDADHLETEIK
jgi:DNA/RNA-binding domain of Phe-tRNA-synthetase-like protein